MEIKYTSDGKKVRVIGRLNSQEIIVQEIFIIDNSEMPSGEHFIVKTLHDAPAKSWKEDNLEKLEKEYKIEKERYEKVIKEFKEKLKKHQIVMKEKLRELNLSQKAFELLEHIIAGKINYYVENQYSNIKIAEFQNELCDYDQEELKLLTLFGDSKGNLNWKLNSYSDGSGWDKLVYPCITYSEALEMAQTILYDQIESEGVNNDMIESAKKYNLIIPSNKLQEYYQTLKDKIKEDINELEQKIEKRKLELQEVIRDIPI